MGGRAIRLPAPRLQAQRIQEGITGPFVSTEVSCYYTMRMPAESSLSAFEYKLAPSINWQTLATCLIAQPTEDVEDA